MAATVEKLAQDALTLSDRERAELAHKLLVSLEGAPEEGVEEAWDAEIAERVARVKEGTAKGRPAEEVLRDIRSRYQ
jgi:putative addiction module component (TIGR02574 family)